MKHHRLATVPVDFSQYECCKYRITVPAILVFGETPPHGLWMELPSHYVIIWTVRISIPSLSPSGSELHLKTTFKSPSFEPNFGMMSSTNEFGGREKVLDLSPTYQKERKEGSH